MRAVTLPVRLLIPLPVALLFREPSEHAVDPVHGLVDGVYRLDALPVEPLLLRTAGDAHQRDARLAEQQGERGQRPRHMDHFAELSGPHPSGRDQRVVQHRTAQGAGLAEPARLRP